MNSPLENDLDLATLSAPVRELVLAAAVRERFRPSQLMADWLTRQGGNLPEPELQAAIDVTLSLGALGGGGERPEGTVLPLPLRRELLVQAGLSEIRATLAREGPNTLAERRFADLVAGQVPDTSAMGRVDLMALASAATWIKDLDGAPQIDPNFIAKRISDQAFVERIGGPDIDNFVGRENLLSALQRLWRVKPRPTVLIEGPGGIGKSIAVARFFQQLLTDGDTQTRPDAILHLDFDLPKMQRATALDMAIEIVRQLALHWSSETNSRLATMLRALGRSDSTRFKVQSVSSRDYRMRSTPQEILDEALDLFSEGRPRRLRLILFADSFERAEMLDETTATNVTRVVDALRDTGADLMVIYAARAFGQPSRLAEGARLAHQSVSRFSQAEAVDYLTTKARQRGVRLTRKMAARANRSIKGWPLYLRIAVSMLRSSHDNFDPTDWLEQIERGGRSAQATLYERLLDRLQDKNLRRLAKPGLLVRRITRDVIERVLAGPCDLPPEVDVDQLMQKAEHEGQLFSRDSSDPGALWHRQDLREIMLPVMRLEVSANVAREIHDAAVAYYAHGDDDIARAEELYHRLCRGDERETVANRWRASAGQRLVGSLAEMPPPAAASLRLLLGGGRSDAVGGGIDELRAVAKNRLSEGVTDLSDIFEQARAPQSLQSLLGDVHAELLIRKGHFDELLAEAELIPGANDLPGSIRARIAISAASVAEGMAELDRALRFWRLAYRFSDHLAALERLTLRIALARLPRRLGSGARARHAHVLAACDLLVAEYQEVASHHVTKLESVAELSEVLQPVRDWQKRVNPAVRSHLLNLFRDLRPMFPSAMENHARREELAGMLGLQATDVHGPADLDSRMSSAFNSADRDLHDRALAALRSEVDVAFAIAVGRGPSGTRSVAPHLLRY
ncbi:MAG: ATP-binding protein [Chromatiaceae bacterium]|nr:ATP-binding protein [Chromatiaceae bacterium]MCP5314902.1 ATP-binding protein [Chromatiaceae bacterium]